ncbi:MAG: T9SS type A sorting domain-containing protein [Bacteroidales bacterium]|jgi:hypothetical protein|nr:T9SS type A sorting domain-containing protein [Bacteroidales bacterium]
MKKKVYYLVVICFLPILMYSQEYEYVAFPTSNAIWSEFYGRELMHNYLSSYDKVTLNGEDTLINQLNYKKLYLFYGASFEISNATYLGAIREENRKVYYIGDTIHQGKPFGYSGLPEILLYDFNVKVGDTLNCNGELLANFYCLIVESIDTISIGNKLRKQISFEGSYAKWIEGIGSVQGLLFAGERIATKGQAFGELICFKFNDEILYFNESYDECMPVGISENIILSNTLIYPNPTSDVINIEVPENILSPRIYMFDVYGRIVRIDSNSKRNYVIDLKGLPKGIYILKIQGYNANLSYKVLKN